MKKFLVLLILFCLPLNASAIEKHLQAEQENLIRGVINSPIGRLSKHHAAIKLDYISYKIGMKQTVFSQIVALENKYAQTDNLNSKYIKKLKNLYMFVASYDDAQSMEAIFLQEFEQQKIVIPDEEYSQLDDELKILLSVVNVYR